MTVNFGVENDPYLADLRKSLEAGWSSMDENGNQIAAAAAADGGDGGSDTAMTDYEKWLVTQQQQADMFRERNATTVMKSLMDSYNLSGLYTKVVEYVKQGYDPEAISVLIRTTPEYKQRFPAMEALAAKGRAISEADYINYEGTAAALERRYGLPDGMLTGKVTDLLVGEVSPTELNDRVVLASGAAIQAPQEIKDMFKNYYGVDSGGMTAYFLDPEIATPLLEKQYASTLIGAEAARQGIGLDVYGAENLQQLGVTTQQAREGFGTVAAATGLTQGRGETTTQQELISGTLGGNAEAQKKIERVAASRVGAFQGGGEVLRTQQGAVGLGTAATR